MHVQKENVNCGCAGNSTVILAAKDLGLVIFFFLNGCYVVILLP